MEVRLMRKPLNFEEVDKHCWRKPITNVTIQKVIVMTNKEWNVFVSDFFKPQDFLPGVVEVINEDKYISIIVDSQGYDYARYVGFEVDTPKLTSCCNAYSTYIDDMLCCKKCYNTVPLGEGDGGGAATMIIE
tara:strand:- start:388 stop:783 length:396 start_codon:yes stop_codon:yes gene_type:complete